MNPKNGPSLRIYENIRVPPLGPSPPYPNPSPPTPTTPPQNVSTIKTQDKPECQNVSIKLLINQARVSRYANHQVRVPKCVSYTPHKSSLSANIGQPYSTQIKPECQNVSKVLLGNQVGVQKHVNHFPRKSSKSANICKPYYSQIEPECQDMSTIKSGCQDVSTILHTSQA